jgi:hypothetical protein
VIVLISGGADTARAVIFGNGQRVVVGVVRSSDRGHVIACGHGGGRVDTVEFAV